MRFKTSNLRDACHTELVSCVGWASPDDVYSVADDHQILRWNLVSAETQKVFTMPLMFCITFMFQVLELPDDFYPTDMHWIPRGGGGAPGRQPSNRHQVNFDKLGKKAAGGSDLFLLTSATGRLQLVGCTMHISILSLSKAHHYCVPKYT